MKKVEWISNETRMIPNIGEGVKGNILEMPDEIAVNFITQGLVKLCKEVVKKSTVKKENE